MPRYLIPFDGGSIGHIPEGDMPRLLKLRTLLFVTPSLQVSGFSAVALYQQPTIVATGGSHRQELPMRTGGPRDYVQPGVLISRKAVTLQLRRVPKEEETVHSQVD